MAGCGLSLFPASAGRTADPWWTATGRRMTSDDDDANNAGERFAPSLCPAPLSLGLFFTRNRRSAADGPRTDVVEAGGRAGLWEDSKTAGRLSMALPLHGTGG